MSFTIQIIRPAPDDEGGPSRLMPERYDTIEEAVRAADAEVATVGPPGAVVYRILDAAGLPVPLHGGTLS